MKRITDIINITELARLTNKSRPTVYKWITLYEQEEANELPQTITELFDLIVNTESKRAVYQFCEEHFFEGNDNEQLTGIINLLRANWQKLDLEKIKNTILEELNND